MPPETPTNYRAWGIDTAVALVWSLTSQDTVRVYASASPSGPFTMIADVEAETYTDSGLTNSVKRYYRLVGVESGVESAATVTLGRTPHKPAVGVACAGPASGPLVSSIFTVTAKDVDGNTTAFYPSEDTESGDGEAVTLQSAGNITFTPSSPVTPTDGVSSFAFTLTAATRGTKTFSIGFPGVANLSESYVADPSSPAGPIAVAVDGLRTLVANVPYFQSLAGADDANEALDSIFVGEVGWPVVSYAVANEVGTFKTREPNDIEVGDTVTVLGASLPFGQLTAISVVDATTFTAGVSGAEDLETVYPDGAFVYVGSPPFVVLTESDQGLRTESIGTGGASLLSGSIDVLLEMSTPDGSANNARDALTDARSILGLLIQGVTTTQGTGDLMFLNRIELVSGPEFVTISEQDSNTRRFERWRALMRATWGIEG